MKKSYIILAAVLALAGILFFVLSSNRTSGLDTLNSFDGDIKIYKSGSCGCCSVFSNYFQNKGNSEAEIVTMDSIEEIKSRYEIPSAMESCHTTIVGDYFVEGHVPVEAVEKLLNEKPNISGIAMPGMPSGAPGMPGVKSGDFIVYSVNEDGSYQEFMRI